MVRIRTRIHDKFSLEFKIWYARPDGAGNSGKPLGQYRLENWIFVPATLDINALTYSREQFYSDITNYYRTITPVYTLAEMAYGQLNCVSGNKISYNPEADGPLGYLSNSVYNLINYPTDENVAEYEYQIKMFCAIYKSAVRERYALLKGNITPEGVAGFRDDSFAVLRNFGQLMDCLKENVKASLYNFCSFGEEFIINLTQSYAYRLYGKDTRSTLLSEWLVELGGYKSSRGFNVLNEEEPMKNANLLYRWSVLKKYVESDLFLSADKRKDGVLQEQVYYSIAAGLSMVFATAVTFTFQQKYGNFTMPLFVALVVSYMLKDRIKELVRSAFSSNRKLKYFDNRTRLSVKDSVIGVCKEGFDIVPQSKVPQDITDIRNRSMIVDVENRINQESVLFYRNLVEVDHSKLAETSEYSVEGINEILMLNLSSFVKKMDNPENSYQICKADGEMVNVSVKKIYYINFICRISYGDQVLCKRYRIAMNRDGIIDLETLR
jgi:hypothetical protein